MASEADLPPADDFLDAARMRAAIGRCLRRQPGGEAASAVRPPVGDFDLNPADLEVRPAVPLRAAAVLVPLVTHAAGPTVLLTRRTDHLAQHAGQISFPGGRVEPEDRDLVDTALRETEEEIGLDRRLVEVVGFLDPYETGTGYHVTPVVGLVEPGFSLRIDPFEVAEAFEVPLGFLLDDRNHQRHSRINAGRQRHYYAMPYGDYYIWGATAGMLMNLYRRARGLI